MRVSRNSVAESDRHQLKILELSFIEYKIIICSLKEVKEAVGCMTEKMGASNLKKNQIRFLDNRYH